MMLGVPASSVSEGGGFDLGEVSPFGRSLLSDVSSSSWMLSLVMSIAVASSESQWRSCWRFCLLSRLAFSDDSASSFVLELLEWSSSILCTEVSDLATGLMVKVDCTKDW